MQLLTTLAGTGKLAGIVGSTGRAGIRLHARAAHTQPRTANQQNARALTGSLAGAWRALTPAQRLAWNAAATGALSGVNLFTSCNRNLLTLGLTPIVCAPGAAPAFPPLSGFQVQPAYSAADLPRTLVSWVVTTQPALVGRFAAVLRATQCLSPAKASIRPSDLRVLAALPAAYTPLNVARAAWWALFGEGQQAGQVSFTLNLVDPDTGYAGPAVATSAPYLVTSSVTPVEGYVTIKQNGVIIATTTGITYEQGGTVIAAA
jgi:hypothetical protein